MNTINRKEFTVTTGISHGREYAFVTHVKTGKQWMSKSEVSEDASLDAISTNIQLGITAFYPDRVIVTCDARFWMPVKEFNHG
jgi:hypothetical protein